MMHFKSSIATVNQNKKQVYTEQEEVRLPPSSDTKVNSNNAPLSSLMVNDNKVSPTYNDYVVIYLFFILIYSCNRTFEMHFFKKEEGAPDCQIGPTFCIK
jgi:hypothetical protein